MGDQLTEPFYHLCLAYGDVCTAAAKAKTSAGMLGFRKLELKGVRTFSVRRALGLLRMHDGAIDVLRGPAVAVSIATVGPVLVVTRIIRWPIGSLLFTFSKSADI